MRRMTLMFLLCATLTLPQLILAQSTGWCGYVLLEGLPLLSNQLSGFEAITPDKSAFINPSSLFQYRFNLDHSAVIIEGCWKTDLTRDLAVSLLSRTIQFDSKAMAAQVEEAIGEAVITGAQVTTDEVVRDYVDKTLIYSIFAQGGTHQESAASARAYLADHLREWETPEQ